MGAGGLFHALLAGLQLLLEAAAGLEAGDGGGLQLAGHLGLGVGEVLGLALTHLKAAKASGNSDFSKIQQIEVQSEFPGRRVNQLEVLTDKGIFTANGDRIRQLFKEGSKILPSSKFKIEKNGKVWVLDGSGFGHGIGMCQMGARARAKAGQSFQEILQAYYPGTSLQCVHSEQ